MTEQKAPNTSPPGLRKRPPWTYLLIALFLLSPIGNIFLTILSHNMDPWSGLTPWKIIFVNIHWSSHLILILNIFTGIALFSVTKRSWLIALVALGINLSYNLGVFAFAGGSARGLFFAITFMTTLGAFYFFMFSSFRLPYLNPRIRWWKSSPRHKTSEVVSIDGIPEPCLLMDVSRSGALIEWRKEAELPTVDDTGKLKIGDGIELNYAVARITDQGVGARFVNNSIKVKLRLKKWLNSLDVIR